jgi:hypothetical protein
MAQVRALTVERIHSMSAKEILDLQVRIPPEAWKSYPEKQPAPLLELETRARTLQGA